MPTGQDITLDSAITDYIDESEQSIHAYKKLFNIAFRGMDMLGMDSFYPTISVELTVSATKTVPFPPSCRQWLKVGILNSNASVTPLVYNKNLTTLAVQAPNRLSVNQNPQANFSAGYDASSQFSLCSSISFWLRRTISW